MKFFVPMFIPFTGLITGIVGSIYGLPIWGALVIVLFAFIVFIYLYKKSNSPVKAYKLNKLHYLWIFLLFVSLGIFSVYVNKPQVPERPEDIIMCKGRITDISSLANGERAILDVSQLIYRNGKTALCKDLKILVKSDIIDASVDDNILIPVKLEKIKDSKNYFNEGYARTLSNRGIIYETRILNEDIKIYNHSVTFSGLAWSCREKLESVIENTTLNKNTQNFLITILLGDRSYLNQDVRTIFSDAGISHILALSGMHVAIIGSILFWLFLPFNFIGKYKLRSILTVLILLIYAFVTGFNPSTVRAVIMMIVVITAIILERKNSAWNSLLIAVSIILIFDPYAILNVGLQLSFLCVFSLIFFVKPLTPFKQHEHPVLYSVATFIISIIVVTAATWCLAAYYFKAIPIAFLPANIIVLPLLPFCLTLSIIYIFFSSIGLDLNFIKIIIESFYDSIINVIRFLTFEGSSSYQFSPSVWSVFIWILLLVSLVILIYYKRTIKPYILSGFLLIMFILSLPFSSEAESEDSFIIQNGIGNVRILSKISNKDSLLRIERNAITECIFANHKIVILDNSLYPYNLRESECDELIIAGGCKENLDKILQIYKVGKIIIHPSVRKKRENQIIYHADSLGIPYHSIRNSGPYRKP